MGCGTSKVLPEPPKDVQLDLVKKVEPFSGTKNDVYKHFITEVDSVGPLKAGLPAASQCANSCPGAPTTGHTEPPSEPPRRARVAKYRAKFDPRVTAKYDIKALIGRGSFSRVVRVEHRATRQPYAIKMIETKYREGREVCESELRVLRRVRHANIIQLVEVFETQERVYMVMELATGGELFDRIIAKGSFTERDATRVLQMVLDGVRYLHALGITHRDLKPENLLYYHPGTDSKIIITDFGLASARKKGDDCLMKTTCGTPEYIAPEVLVRKPYTNSVDMWALGVIAYILLSGTMPFEDDNRTRLYRQILRGKYSYSGEALFPTSFSFLLLGPHPPPARSQGGGFCLVRKPKHRDGECLDQRRGTGCTATECLILLKLSKRFSSWAASVCAFLSHTGSVLLSAPEAPLPRISSVPFSLLSFRPTKVQGGGL
ncbi:serine/threonine-protein kinase H1 isoform X1 [Phyllostomus discolor]|uniref:Serine/threonine-protein kinase H1 isoform X1 n=1 Tax=Phyllostomus discolor TaxID=89673 RepID=A0A7E6CM04_9CHIR|nr:serine/threonine-protein kinase H1 isoform X1 [Phyllostomus discolor]